MNGMVYIYIGMGTLAIHGALFRDKRESVHFRIISPMIMCVAAIIIRSLCVHFPKYR